MTLLACQIFSTIAHEGSFARTAEQLHLTPSAISHAVSTMETECGFPLFTRTKSGVTMTAAAENLLPAIQRLLVLKPSGGNCAVLPKATNSKKQNGARK